MAKSPKPSSQREQKSYNTFLKYSSLGLQLVITLALAGGLGYWIDQKLGFRFPVFLLTFLIIALTGSLYLLYKNLQE